MNLPEKLRSIKNAFSTKQKPTVPSPTMPKLEKSDSLLRIKQLRSNGFSPKVIVDGGALVGLWSKKVSSIFEDAHFILVEPNPTVYDQIKSNISSISDRGSIAQCALGEAESTLSLNIWENNNHKNTTTKLAASSLLDHVQGDASTKIEVPVRPLDHICEELNLIPDMIKLDLQGYELTALRGCTKSLKMAEVCMIEFGCLDAYKDRTTPAELVSFMSKNEFSLYDIVDLRYRPYDNALCGGDFIFVKNSSPLKDHKDYF